MKHDDTRFDDDRLLAFASGLEDDPELEAAVADDVALHERLAAMRADVEALGTGLDRVVPAPPDDYTDLGDPRWGELRELVTAPAPVAPRRRPFWLRVLAPAAAVVLVLVAGVVGVQRLGDFGGGESATMSTGEKAAEANDQGYGAAQGDSATGATKDDGAAVPSLGRGAPDPAAYATILVARAALPAAYRQRFEVLRVLRAEGGGYYARGDSVRLDIVERAVVPDRLVVLYLDPIQHRASERTPSAAATPAPTARDLEGAIVEYQYGGATALAQQLPIGADPAKVALP